jgi:RHS repeat-associated protein
MRTLRLVARSVRIEYPGTVYHAMWPGDWSVQYATYNYLKDGKLDYQDYVNGVHTAYGYDPRGFLNHLTVTRSGQTYAERTYYRDGRDRITAIQKGSNSGANPMENGRGDHFWYDPEGQLTDAYYDVANPAAASPTQPNRSEYFRYDALGNRMGSNYLATHGWMGFAREDNGLNQYHTWGSYPASYDDDIGGDWGSPQHANGVLMQDGNITAGYNAVNQVVMVNTAAMGSNWIFFGYDPLGRCVKRWSGTPDMSAPFPWIPPATSNPATYFYYDGWNLIQEGPSASVINRIYMLGNRVDEIVADYAPANGQWMFHHSEGRGHTMLLTGWNGTLAEQNEYDAFGQPYFYAGNGTVRPNGSAYGNRFLFTGREYLSDLKLYDYRNRMYQPELGRFMQPDPKEFGAGDYNLYRYCHNDPVNRSDPTGLELDAVYSIEKQTLIVTNLDNGQRISLSGSSGSNRLSDVGLSDRGPIPLGNYSMYDRGADKNGASRYILDANDSSPKNDTLDGKAEKEGGGRYAFRLHAEDANAPQKGSEGCVVVSRDNLGKIDKMASDTTKGPKATIVSEGRKPGERTDIFRDKEKIGILRVTK